MIGSIFWGLIPFVVVSVIWAANGDSPVHVQNIALGLLGAVVGAAGLIWLGYVVRDPGSPGRAARRTAAPNARSPRGRDLGPRLLPVGTALRPGRAKRRDDRLAGAGDPDRTE